MVLGRPSLANDFTERKFDDNHTKLITSINYYAVTASIIMIPGMSKTVVSNVWRKSFLVINEECDKI